MPPSNCLRRWTIRILSGLTILSSPVLADTLSAQTIDNSGNAGASSAITVIENRAVIAYYDTGNTDLKLFYDDGNGGGTAGDGQANGTEIRTIDASITVDPQAAVGQSDGTVAVAYYTNNELRLWVDDGGLNGLGTAKDFVADADEFRTIDSLGNVGQQPSIGYVGTRLAISYYDVTNTALKLWYDDGNGAGVADDERAQGDELRTIDPNDTAGTFNALAVWKGHLVVAYYVDAAVDSLRIWIDDGRSGGTADNGLADGGEIRIIDTGGVIGKYVDVTVVNDQLAVVYYDETNTALELWYDDGNGGGTAGDGVVDPAERRTLDDSGNVGEFAGITSINGVLAVSYYDTDTDDLKLWRDDGTGGGTSRNGLNDGGSTEVRDGDTGGDVGQATAITTRGADLLVSYLDVTNSALKLLTATLTADPDDPNDLTLTACNEGTATTDKTPTFTFTLDDIDPNDVFSYQIQIDDTSNAFGSVILDYTSVNTLTRGSSSFTVGQAAGSGTYTTGAANQTLPVDTYFWRVRSNDGTTNSGWTEGTSFSITEPEVGHVNLTATVNEAVSSLSFEVSLSTASCETVTVDYTTVDGTANAGSDYTATSGTLSFNPGQTTRNINVTLSGDSLNEDNETFTLTLSSPTNATLKAGSETTTITLQDDDTAAVSIDQSFNSTLVQEGELTDSYDVVLTSQPTSNVIITATPAGEIDLGAGVGVAITLTFTPANWNIVQTVTVTAVDDTEIEAVETATITHVVTSADADYNNFPAVSVTVTIRDNDSDPTDDSDPNDPDDSDPNQTPPSVLLPDLALSASGPGTNVTVGEPLLFTVTLTNNGGVDATETVIEIPVPTGLSFTGAAFADGTTAPTTASNGVLAITIGTLPPVQPSVITLSFSANQAGSYRITPTALAANADQQAATVSDNVLAVDPPEDTTPPTTSAPCVLFPFTVLGLLASVWRRLERRG